MTHSSYILIIMQEKSSKIQILHWMWAPKFMIYYMMFEFLVLFPYIYTLPPRNLYLGGDF